MIWLLVRYVQPVAIGIGKLDLTERVLGKKIATPIGFITATQRPGGEKRVFFANPFHFTLEVIDILHLDSNVIRPRSFS